MEKFVDYYALLGIERSADAEAVKAAYERLVAEAGSSQRTPAENARTMRLYDRAFFVLGDERRRTAYDICGEGGLCDFGEEPDKSLPVDGSEGDEYRRVLERRIYESSGREGDAWARAYASLLMESARKSHPPFRWTTTLSVGVVFAAALSIAWTMKFSFAGVLPAEPASPFERLVAAARGPGGAGLWATMFGGALFLWCAILALTENLAAWIAETSFYHSVYDSGFSPRYKSILLRSELVLLVVLLVAWVMLPVVWDAVHMKDNLTYPIGPLLFFFLPLFAGTCWYDDDGAIRFIVWQICVFLAHPFFVLFIERSLLGSASLYDYAAGGLHAFGYASWWLLSFAGYRACEWLSLARDRQAA